MVRLVYDVAGTPRDLGLANVVKIFESHRVVLWDSTLDGTKPKLYGESGDLTEDNEVKIVDVIGKEIDIDAFQAEFEANEFWDKELHKCKKSPIYWYSNYASPSFPVNQKELGKWLQENGLVDIAQDDTDKESTWAKQKEAVEKVTGAIEIDDLKRMKDRFDGLVLVYGEKLKEDEKVLEAYVNLKDSEGKSLDIKKKTSNIIAKLLKCKIPEEYIGYTFKEQPNRWDKAMVGVTPYHILIDMLLKAK